jgi:DHA1 family bicyclomycin/chloramphenicol resistance-like MFS transporter
MIFRVTSARFAGGRSPSFGVLVLLSGVSPLATDMYLSSLPAIAADLGSSASSAQLTLTAFLIGLALGMVVLGPLSDSGGRRILVLSGPAGFAAASLVCAWAPTARVLIGARLVQGFVGAAGAVCARAIVSDWYRGDEAAGRFGLLSAVGFLAPVIAPSLGTLVLLIGDWRLMFYLLAVVGVAQFLGVLFRVPETLPVGERHPGSVSSTARRIADLLHDRRFTVNVVIVSVATMGFFSYIGGSSFVLEGVYHLSSARFGLLFAVNAVVMALSSYGFSRLVRRYLLVTLRTVGLAVAGSAALLLLILGLVVPGHTPALALVWVLLACVTAGMGLLLPASIALSQEAGQHAKGTAAALSGGISFGCGAAITPVTGILGNDSLIPMAGLMATFLVIALLVSQLVRLAPVPQPMSPRTDSIEP